MISASVTQETSLLLLSGWFELKSHVAHCCGKVKQCQERLFMV
jgi:hypothetical protein